MPRSFVSIRTTVRVAATCAAFLFGPGTAWAQVVKEKEEDPRDPRPDLELRRRLEPLVPAVRGALQGNSPDAQRAALAALADFPAGLLFQANLSGAIAALLERDLKDPEIIALGLRSFGKSYPERPEVVARVFGRHVASEHVQVRKAAADGLANLLQTAVPSRGSVDNATYFIEMSGAALPLAGRLLEDKDAAVQRPTLAVVQTATRVVIELYAQDTGPLLLDEPKPKDREARFAPLRPVLRAIGAVVPTLAAPLSSPDPDTRIAAARTAELVAGLRYVIASTAGVADQSPADPPGGWVTLRPVVTERMKDPSAAVRLAVTEALEAMGGAFDSKVLLREAISDPNPFVRWAAARALGKTAPARPVPAAVAEDVAALSRLWADPDMDVRMAGLNALAKFGLGARAATPVVLTAAERGDVEPRVVALRTLAALQSEAGPTVPVLTRALSDPDVRLRRAAAAGLVRFGPDARPALPELRRAVLSDDQELRLSAAEAILAIERPARLKDL